MNYFFQSLKAVFIKDVLIELRSRQVLPTMIVQGMLIVWVLRIAGQAVSSDVSVMGAAALWIALIFSGLLAQERSFATEHDQECIYGLIAAPIDEGTIYLAKLLVNVVMLSVYELVLTPIVMIAFKLSLSGNIGLFILVLMLGNIGISSVGTLFSAVVQLTRTRGSLLSILVLAVLAPMMIPATFSLLVLFNAIPAELIGTGALAFVGTLKAAIGYMIAFDAVFVTACWLLFGFIVKE
jgi:heme exporter protein B